MCESMIKRFYKKVFPDFYTSVLVKELRGCDSILDLGCGKDSAVKFIDASYKVGVDSFKPYIEESRKKKIHHKYIIKDITKLKIKPKSFDAVVALDVIEHLNKKDGLNLIKNMERWAREKIIIFTPNSFLRQEEYDENVLQVHRSGWTVKEFRKLGFKVYGISGLKILRKEKAELKFKPTWFWSVISHLSQKFTFYFPDIAFQLFAVKEIEK